MKFVKKQSKWGNCHWTGRKNSFIFNYSQNSSKWYVVVNHTKLDIWFNTLWQNIEFDTEEETQTWCENFDYQKYKCIGDDV